MIRIRGRIFGREATLRARADVFRGVLAVGAGGSIPLLIDTGFTGGLMLPQRLIARLRFEPISIEDFRLADGTRVTLPYYRGRVRIGRRILEARVIPGDGLIGMEFLEAAFDALRMEFRGGRFELTGPDR